MAGALTAISFETLVRPFGYVASAPVNRVPPAPVTDLEAEPPAYIVWGDASQFVIPERSIDRPIIVRPDPDPDAVDPDAINQDSNFENIVNLPPQEGSLFDETNFEFREERRTTETVRVYNPEEADLPEEERTQWLDVERITSITFRTPDGLSWKFTLNHEAA